MDTSIDMNQPETTSSSGHKWHEEIMAGMSDHFEIGDMFYKIGKEEGLAEGYKEGLSARDKILYKAISENIDNAGDDTITLIQALQEKGFKVHGAKLRVRSETDVDVMVIIEKGATIKDEFLPIYSFVAQYEKVQSTEVYHIRFSFIEDSPSINNIRLFADGYKLKLNEEFITPN